ncbi:MAG: ABC transporter ATP-binding protein [Clostridiales bacterium]|nr:ABC transporter ATP-binding protein [Clostridiales bacterium]
MKEILLSGRKIKKIFRQGEKEVRVLDDVSLDIFKGEFTVIMGASGAGKSTLLYAFSGMDRISGGSVTYKEKEISACSENELANLRAKEFGFVFQQTHLVSNLTLFENVAVAGYVAKKEKPKAVARKAEKLLAQMQVNKAKDRLPAEVSGGEAQRAAIARAMIAEPGIIFADEPTGALNKSNSVEVLNLLSELNRAGQTILMVTHDVQAAIRGSRILYLEDGKLLDEISLDAWEPGKVRQDLPLAAPYACYGKKKREEKVSAWLSALRW